MAQTHYTACNSVNSRARVTNNMQATRQRARQQASNPRTRQAALPQDPMLSTALGFRPFHQRHPCNLLRLLHSMPLTPSLPPALALRLTHSDVQSASGCLGRVPGRLVRVADTCACGALLRCIKLKLQAEVMTNNALAIASLANAN